MRPDLAVLNYHGIESSRSEYAWEPGELLYVIELPVFEQHLAVIRDCGRRVLSLTELSEWFRMRSSPALVLSFDDGHISHFQHVAPLLKKKGLPAVFFVSASRVGSRGYAGWSHLRAMIAEGFDIGAHGDTHVPLPPLDSVSLERETCGAKKKLEDGLGAAVRSFSIPRGYYSRRVGETLREAGYEFIFTSHFGLNHGQISPGYLKRMALTRLRTRLELESWLAGNLGMRGVTEELKEILRQGLGPAFYDAAAGIKARILKGADS